MIDCLCWRTEQAPQGFGHRRPSFSVPRLRHGVHRPAAAALRSGAGVGYEAGLLSRDRGGLVAGCRYLAKVMPQSSSRDRAGMSSIDPGLVVLIIIKSLLFRGT